MPSVSSKQHRLMEAIDHGWHKPGGGGPSKAVAHEFVEADKGRSFAGGGVVSSMGNKGHMSREESFAKGGEVLGREKSFLKTEDRFRGEGGRWECPESKTDDNFGKDGGKKEAPTARTSKVLKTIKPHS